MDAGAVFSAGRAVGPGPLVFTPGNFLPARVGDHAMPAHWLGHLAVNAESDEHATEPHPSVLDSGALVGFTGSIKPRPVSFFYVFVAIENGVCLTVYTNSHNVNCARGHDMSTREKRANGVGTLSVPFHHKTTLQSKRETVLNLEATVNVGMLSAHSSSEERKNNAQCSTPTGGVSGPLYPSRAFLQGMANLRMAPLRHTAWGAPPSHKAGVNPGGVASKPHFTRDNGVMNTQKELAFAQSMSADHRDVDATTHRMELGDALIVHPATLVGVEKQSQAPSAPSGVLMFAVHVQSALGPLQQEPVPNDAAPDLDTVAASSGRPCAQVQAQCKLPLCTWAASPVLPHKVRALFKTAETEEERLKATQKAMDYLGVAPWVKNKAELGEAWTTEQARAFTATGGGEAPSWTKPGKAWYLEMGAAHSSAPRTMVAQMVNSGYTVVPNAVLGLAIQSEFHAAVKKHGLGRSTLHGFENRLYSSVAAIVCSSDAIKTAAAQLCTLYSSVGKQHHDPWYCPYAIVGKHKGALPPVSLAPVGLIAANTVVDTVPSEMMSLAMRHATAAVDSAKTAMGHDHGILHARRIERKHEGKRVMFVRDAVMKARTPPKPKKPVRVPTAPAKPAPTAAAAPVPVPVRPPPTPALPVLRADLEPVAATTKQPIATDDNGMGHDEAWTSISSHIRQAVHHINQAVAMLPWATNNYRQDPQWKSLRALFDTKVMEPLKQQMKTDGAFLAFQFAFLTCTSEDACEDVKSLLHTMLWRPMGLGASVWNDVREGLAAGQSFDSLYQSVVIRHLEKTQYNMSFLMATLLVYINPHAPEFVTFTLTQYLFRHFTTDRPQDFRKVLVDARVSLESDAKKARAAAAAAAAATSVSGRPPAKKRKAKSNPRGDKPGKQEKKQRVVGPKPRRRRSASSSSRRATSVSNAQRPCVFSTKLERLMAWGDDVVARCLDDEPEWSAYPSVVPDAHKRGMQWKDANKVVTMYINALPTVRMHPDIVKGHSGGKSTAWTREKATSALGHYIVLPVGCDLFVDWVHPKHKAQNTVNYAFGPKGILHIVPLEEVLRTIDQKQKVRKREVAALSRRRAFKKKKKATAAGAADSANPPTAKRQPFQTITFAHAYGKEYGTPRAFVERRCMFHHGTDNTPSVTLCSKRVYNQCVGAHLLAPGTAQEYLDAGKPPVKKWEDMKADHAANVKAAQAQQAAAQNVSPTPAPLSLFDQYAT